MRSIKLGRSLTQNLSLTFCAAVLGVSMSACGSGSNSAPHDASVADVADAAPLLAPELGGGHISSSVTLTEIATVANKLNKPRDLAFNPLRPDELWVVNFGDESVVIVHDASTDGRTSEYRKDGFAMHFMANVSAISFGADQTSIGRPGTFGTAGESRNTYDESKAANDFMGPTLWSSDLTIFAMKDPNGLGSHLDMLHCSPLSMGIAHQTANIYWVFGGLTNSIVKYDFHKDNGVGNDNHSDGEAFRYVSGQMKYAPGIPSHLFFHAADGMLYIADTGHGRIAMLDTASGTKGKALPTTEPMVGHYEMNGAILTEVVPQTFGIDGLLAPSGIEIQNELIYVSDNATGRISAFDMTGTRVNYLDTGLPPNALSGMAFGPDGKLYFVDMLQSRVLRIDPN